MGDGDADGGDDRADTARAREGSEHSLDRAGSAGVTGDGGEVREFGRDGAGVPADDAALSEAGGLPGDAGATAGGERDAAAAGPAGLSRRVRSAEGGRLHGRLRRGAAVRRTLEEAAADLGGRRLRAADVRGRGGLPVRLGRGVDHPGRGDDQGAGGARAAVPQPDAVRRRLPATDPGDGIRRPRPRRGVLRRPVRARRVRARRASAAST